MHIVHGAVMVIVDIEVMVLTSVIVTLTAGGMLVMVMTEPVLSVVVVVTGGGVELMTMAETGVLPEGEVASEELLTIEL